MRAHGKGLHLRTRHAVPLSGASNSCARASDGFESGSLGPFRCELCPATQARQFWSIAITPWWENAPVRDVGHFSKGLVNPIDVGNAAQGIEGLTGWCHLLR